MVDDVRFAEWDWTWLDHLLQDIRYGVRLLLKQPGFTAAAVLALAIAIGANVALFSVVNAVLLRPLGYPNPDELVMVWKLRFATGGLGASTADFLAWRDQAHSFDGMAAFVHKTWNLSGEGDPIEVEGLGVTPDFFSVLGVEPARGQLFAPEVSSYATPRAAIVSDRLWQSWLHRGSDAIGRRVRLNGEPYTIVGILPPSFNFINAAAEDIFVPIPLYSTMSTGNSLSVLARLHPEATREQAEAELAVIAARQRSASADSFGLNPSVVPLASEIEGNTEALLLPLFGAVACVLLIGCATLANLLLARATARRKEMAVRSSLGASRGRLISQMLTETVTLALAGGLAGLLLTHWLLGLVIAIHPKGLPRIGELNIDGDVMLFAFALSILTGILCGVGFALRASRVNLETTLKEEGSSLAGSRRQWLRSGLIVAEVALSLVLLIGAGLLLNSFVRLIHVDAGFRTHHVLTMRVTLPGSSYDNMQRTDSFYERLVERVERLPGVESAGLANFLPLGRGVIHEGFTFQEGPPWELGDGPEKGWNGTAVYYVSSHYLAAMGTRILKGRGLAEFDDHPGAPPALIVNQTFVREFLPNQNPIEKRIRLDVGNRWFTIAGVSEDMKNGGLGDDQLWLSKPPFRTIYVPYVFRGSDLLLPENAGIGRNMYLVVRSAGEPLRMSNAIRHAVSSIDPSQPIADVKTMDERVMDLVASRRLGMWPLVIFASMALLLAAGGIYGLVAYTVAQRTREIGIRVALGAGRADVLWLAMRDTMSLALVGMLIGAVGAHWLTRLLASQLYAITATDLATYIAVIGLLLAVVALATYIPARMAGRIDPMVALRFE
jgi:putative ABC transport system permease protein